MLESWPLHVLNMVMIALLSVPFERKLMAEPGENYNPYQSMADFFVKPGDPEIGGSLNGLTMLGDFEADSDRSLYRLIYFGTSYRIGSCASDLLVIQRSIELLKNRCGTDVANLILPILVYPEGGVHSGQPATNLMSYVTAADARIFGVSGPAKVVFAIANGYGATYELDENGLVTSHTRSSYLMGPDGKNLAIFDDGTPFGLITGRLIEEFRLDSILQKNQTPGCY